MGKYNKNNGPVFSPNLFWDVNADDLDMLQQMPLLQNSRLVGGTALALQLGHRNSIDLDFFGEFQNSYIDFLNTFNNEDLTVNSLQNTKSILNRVEPE